MNVFRHPAVADMASVEAIDALIANVNTATRPRVRDTAVRQLYSIGATLYDISKALEHDLDAGGTILNQRTHEEQNAAPETQLWLEWLAMYEAIHWQMARIAETVNAVKEAA